MPMCPGRKDDDDTENAGADADAVVKDVTGCISGCGMVVCELEGAGMVFSKRGTDPCVPGAAVAVGIVGNGIVVVGAGTTVPSKGSKSVYPRF